MHSSLYKDIEFVLYGKPKPITQGEKNEVKVETLYTAGIQPTPQLYKPMFSIIAAFHSQGSGERLSLGTQVARPQPASSVMCGHRGRGTAWIPSPGRKRKRENVVLVWYLS